MEEKTNKKTVLILGIVSIVISIIPIFGVLSLIPALIAIVLQITDIKNKRQNSIVGFILSILALFFTVLWLFIMFDSSNETELKSTNESLQTQLNESLQKIDELSQEDKQEEIKNKINSLETEKNNISTSIESLKSEKQKLESTIEKLKGDVITLKGSPVNYPAGYFTAGKDFETGRYKIYNGSSNFIVYSSSGALRVNIILGDWGVNEYIYTFEYGDKVQAESSYTLVPVN